MLATSVTLGREPIARIDSAMPAATAPKPAGVDKKPPLQLLLAVLDEVNHGLLLVNEMAEVRYANRAATRDCRPDQPLHYDGQRLRAAQACDFDALLRALASARSGRRAMLTLHSARSSVSVGIVPVMARPEDGDTVALLVLGKHDSVEPLNLQFFAQMNQLTPAESVVLAALCEGLRPVQVAARGGVALSTIRSQIGSIRQKTRTQSVSHVVRMVQTLPPVVPALNVCRPDASCVSSSLLAQGQMLAAQI